MSTTTPSPTANAVRPPSKHELALMIWVAVFPTLLMLAFAFGALLEGLPTVLRTFIMATVAVPIVIYGIMPQLHRARRAIILRKKR